MRQCDRCGINYIALDVDAGTYLEHYCSETCEYITDLEIEVHELKQEVKKQTDFAADVEKDFNKLVVDYDKWKDDYINDDTYFRSAERHKIPAGEIVCPHCNVGTMGLIKSPVCHWCYKNFWDKVE